MFGASALALSLIRLGPAADAPTVRGSVVAEFAAGFRFLWATPVLRWLTILLTVVSLLAVGMPDVLIFAVRCRWAARRATSGWPWAWRGSAP